MRLEIHLKNMCTETFWEKMTLILSKAIQMPPATTVDDYLYAEDAMNSTPEETWI